MKIDRLKDLPPVVFELAIPQIMSVMSALTFSIMTGHYIRLEILRHYGPACLTAVGTMSSAATARSR